MPQRPASGAPRVSATIPNMPAPQEITLSNQDAEDLISTVAEIAERLKRMETKFDGLFGAWSVGGLRGLRQAARGASNGG